MKIQHLYDLIEAHYDKDEEKFRDNFCNIIKHIESDYTHYYRQLLKLYELKAQRFELS